MGSMLEMNKWVFRFHIVGRPMVRLVAERVPLMMIFLLREQLQLHGEQQQIQRQKQSLVPWCFLENHLLTFLLMTRRVLVLGVLEQLVLI